MTLQQLEYALAIATHQHFGRAAEACFVTQPTLSMQLQKLEDELGFSLFDRRKQPIEPTEAGAAYLEQARQIMRETSRLDVLAKDLKNELEGRLRIGVIPTLGPYLMPQLLPDFMKAYPGIKIDLQELTTPQCIASLRKDAIDLALLALPLAEPDLEERTLFFEPFSVFISPQHPLFGQPEIKLQDLDQEGLWLMGEGHCLRNQVLEICSKAVQGLPGRVNLVASTLETLKAMVENGMGFTLLPELAIKRLPEEQRTWVHLIEGTPLVREVGLVMPKTHITHRLVVRFERFIKQHPMVAQLAEMTGQHILSPLPAKR